MEANISLRDDQVCFEFVDIMIRKNQLSFEQNFSNFNNHQNLWIGIPHKQGEVGSVIPCYEGCLIWCYCTGRVPKNTKFRQLLTTDILAVFRSQNWRLLITLFVIGVPSMLIYSARRMPRLWQPYLTKVVNFDATRAPDKYVYI